MRKTTKVPKRKASGTAEYTYMLRTCAEDMTSHGGFKWPEKGAVTCPDWSPEPRCGNGLHGLLMGNGDGGVLSWDSSAKWLVVKVRRDEVVKIDDAKVKVPRGEVVYCGDRKGAGDYLMAAGATSVHGATATAGNRGTATAGDAGTATAGDAGTATAGYAGTATAGDAGTATAGHRGTATAGNCGTATAGNRGTATAGDAGTATAGDAGTATAGDAGTATAGDAGTATAGNRGTATAGDCGTATAGDAGTATAGDAGILNLRWWDGKRYRIVIAYVGENGVKSNTPYRLDEHGELCEVKP